ISDVVDLELVEAQQRSLTGETARDFGDRPVGLGAPLPLDAVVHLEHEGVEMYPPLAKARHRAEEQVHQHRLAAADRTAQIKSDRRVTAAVLGKAEAGEPAAQTGFRPVVQQGAIEALQS